MNTANDSHQSTSNTTTTNTTALSSSSVASQMLREDVRSIVAGAMASLENLKATREQILKRGEEAAKAGGDIDFSTSPRNTHKKTQFGASPDRGAMSDIIASPRAGKGHNGYENRTGGDRPNVYEHKDNNRGTYHGNKPNYLPKDAYRESETEVSLLEPNQTGRRGRKEEDESSYTEESTNDSQTTEDYGRRHEGRAQPPFDYRGGYYSSRPNYNDAHHYPQRSNEKNETRMDKYEDHYRYDPPVSSSRREHQHSQRATILPTVNYNSDFGKRFGVQPADLPLPKAKMGITSQKPFSQNSAFSSAHFDSHSKKKNVTSSHHESRVHVTPRGTHAQPTTAQHHHRTPRTPPSEPSTVNESDASHTSTHKQPKEVSQTPSNQQAALAQAVKDLDTYQTTIEQLTQQVKSLSTELAKAQVTAKQKEMDCDTTVAGLKVSHQKELTQLLADLTAAKHKAVTEAVDSIRNQYEAEMERLKAELTTSKTQQQDVNRRFQQFKKDHGQQKERISQLEEVIATHAKEMDTKNKRLEDLQRVVKDSKHFRKVAEDQLITKDHEIELEIQKQNTLDAQVADLTHKLRMAEEGNKAFEEQADRELKRLSALFEENRIVQEERLAEALGRAEKHEKLKAKSKEIKQQLSDTTAQLAEAREQLTKAENEIATLQDMLEDARSQREEERASLTQALQLEREGYQSFLKQTDETLAAVHKEYSEKFALLKTQCEKLDYALQHCQGELEEERAAKEAEEHKVTDLQLQLESVTERARLSEALSKEKFEAYKQHTNDTISSLKKQLGDRDKRMEQLAVMSTGNSDTIQRLRDNLAAERSRNATLEAQMREVKGLAKRVGDNLQREVRRTEIRSLYSSNADHSIDSPRAAAPPLPSAAHQLFPYSPSIHNTSTGSALTDGAATGGIIASAARAIQQQSPALVSSRSPSGTPPTYFAQRGTFPPTSRTPSIKESLQNDDGDVPGHDQEQLTANNEPDIVARAPTLPPSGTDGSVAAMSEGGMLKSALRKPLEANVSTTSTLVSVHYDAQMSKFREQTNSLYHKLTTVADNDFRQQCLASVRGIDYTGGAGRKDQGGKRLTTSTESSDESSET